MFFLSIKLTEFFSSLLSIRGTLTSFLLLSMNMGILIAYILGAYVEYTLIPYICGIVPIAFAILFTMLPNTPRFHLAQGNVQVSNSNFTLSA